MKRLLLALLAGCGAHSGARPTLAPEVAELDLTVSDLARATEFFVDGLAFRPAGRGRVTLGEQVVALHPSAGRAIPADSRSNDLWFEHMAIVVADMDAAYARVTALGARPISAGPQTIPASNPAAGGIRAFYFEDADGHDLELIWYPAGKGEPRWQARDGRLFLGIDHTAIGVADTERSLHFYRDLLGLEVKGRSLNEGIEQERLSGVPGARVRITGLGGAGGPGVELLEYLAPGPGRPAPADTRPDDAWYWEIVVAVDDLAAARARLGLAAAADPVLTDPDGHHVRLVLKESPR
jgi:catechol 2,3-dioxygenase-like lactoylglutathione lyase family enzyme